MKNKTISSPCCLQLHNESNFLIAENIEEILSNFELFHIRNHSYLSNKIHIIPQ